MGLHTVGRGSERPAEAQAGAGLQPDGDKDAPVLCLPVGKVSPFDLGGYSIKQSAFMDSMKSDMGRRGDSNGRAGVRHYPWAE